jgi:hypothetical protein
VVAGAGRWLAQVDLAWPEAKLVVEYEGAYHFQGTQIVEDDDRCARLVAAGWRVIRLSSADSGTWMPSSPGSRRRCEPRRLTLVRRK